MEAADSSKMLVPIYQTIRRYTQEDQIKETVQVVVIVA
jgi:hypothetical protein